MTRTSSRSSSVIRPTRALATIVCAALLAPGDPTLFAQAAPAAAPAPAAASEAKLTADQLDSLVAPIALYPDELLANVLAASTYPLEVVQADRWLKDNDPN